MKRLTWISALLLAFAGPVLAGGKSYHCTVETQECLDTMVRELQNRGWVGIEMDTDEKSGLMVITRVIPGSPAEASGFHVGDALLSINGIPIDEAHSGELRANRQKMVPRAKMEYVIGRAGIKKKVDLYLATLPRDVYEQMVGMHMLDHASAKETKEPPAEKPSKAPSKDGKPDKPPRP